MRKGATHSCTALLSPPLAWQRCYYTSQLPIAGVVMHGSFMLFVMIVLVNTLIAMMADTYNRVQVTGV
jgi:hypothetical protein